jgi:Protein of unknown function (DUF4231)
MTVEHQNYKYPQDIDEHLRSLLEQLRKIKEYHVNRKLKWYKKNGKTHKIYFRVSGVLIILLSTSIPFIASRNFSAKNIVLSIFALIIAALSGLISFFHWDHSWRNYMQTYFALKHLASEWEMSIIRVEQETDLQKAKESAINATVQLLNNARLVTKTEAADFFKHIESPQVEKEGEPD